MTSVSTNALRRCIIEKFVNSCYHKQKEASETGCRLELLHRTKYIDEQTFKNLFLKCTSLRVMLIVPCKTAKESVK
ncbi:MAG: four helix bundle protein [Oscillospiraceae bacterium]|nr:four helix bundle protein [Oscillospiraceae bacterium]